MVLLPLTLLRFSLSLYDYMPLTRPLLFKSNTTSSSATDLGGLHPAFVPTSQPSPSFPFAVPGALSYLKMPPNLPLTHRPLDHTPNNPINQILAIMILILIILSIVNGIYIAYTEGRAAGQRQWARDLGLVTRGEYRDEYDSDDESVRARLWMQDEQYDADNEENSMLSF